MKKIIYFLVCIQLFFITSCLTNIYEDCGDLDNEYAMRFVTYEKNIELRNEIYTEQSTLNSIKTSEDYRIHLLYPDIILPAENFGNSESFEIGKMILESLSGMQVKISNFETQETIYELRISGLEVEQTINNEKSIKRIQISGGYGVPLLFYLSYDSFYLEKDKQYLIEITLPKKTNTVDEYRKSIVIGLGQCIYP